MKREIRNILETPFTSDQIKQRKGLWGRMLDYIEGHNVIGRLNAAFESDWSFSVIEHHVMDNEVVVLGQLQVHDIVKQQFGSSGITRDSQTGEMLCLGDDLKAATTDALKKAASLFGIGLHLYGDVDNGNGHIATESPERSRSKYSNGETGGNHNRNPSNGNGNGNNGKGNGNGLITPRQMRYLLSLGRRQNMPDNAVEELAVEWFGTPLSRIEKVQASEMITQLSA